VSPRPTAPSQVLARVDDELRGLWSARPAPGETPTARARTANLVVVASTPALAETWQAIIDDVVQNVPARAIVVGLDPDGADGLEASVSGVCSPSSGGAPAVCSERISLVARGAMCGRVPSVVGSLCLSDVTTTLVWLGRVHTDDPAFGPLAEGAGRIVLDASQGSVMSLANVVYWARALPVAERPGLADLTWTRLSIWQELCARMFDEPRLRALSSHVTGVTVTQASDRGAALGPEGALLLAWLATRLGWKATSLGGKLRLVRADGVAVKVSLRAQPVASAPPSRLQAVSLEASDAGLTMTGQVVREEDAATWTLDASASAGASERRRLEHRVRLVTSETARLLERTLRRPVRDDALASAVAWADQLRGEELACA
jgi:glucose-6-phosphate dehydrogenase assembly protein OpcA